MRMPLVWKIFLPLLCLCACTSMALASEPFTTVGIYPAENGALVSVASGRITTALESARAQRLAREQALRKARYQLAKHVHNDSMQSAGKYSVQMQGGAVIHESVQGNLFFVALQALPQEVTLVPLSPLEDFQEVNVAPLVDELLTKMPLLAEGGANVFTMSTGWVALGVGYAALPEEAPHLLKETHIREAATVARVAAAKELTAFIHGIQVSTQDEQKEHYSAGQDSETFKQWIRSSTREEVEGALNGAQWAGQWTTSDGHVAVALVVARPALDLGFAAQEGTAMVLHKSDITPEWQEIIASRPWIMEGGVSLCTHEGALYALAVESGTLQNNPAFDRMQLPTLIDTKARSQITRFLVGLSSHSVTTDEEIQRTNLDKTEVSKHVSTLSREGVSGVVTQIQRLGSWYSKDEKKLFQAFIVPLP